MCASVAQLIQSVVTQSLAVLIVSFLARRKPISSLWGILNMIDNNLYWSRLLEKGKRQRAKREQEWAHYKNQTKKAKGKDK